MCSDVGAGSFDPEPESHASDSPSSRPLTSNALSWSLISHSRARTSSRVCVRTWARSVSRASTSRSTAGSKPFVNETQLSLPTWSGTAESSTSHASTGTTRLFAWIAESSSAAQILERIEAGDSTIT